MKSSRGKVKVSRKLPLFITALVNAALLAAVFFLMGRVQNLLNSDTKINLTEIVTQNKDVITSKLMLEVNNLDLAAKQLADHYNSGKQMKSYFIKFVKQTGDKNLFFALGEKSWTSQEDVISDWLWRESAIYRIKSCQE